MSPATARSWFAKSNWCSVGSWKQRVSLRRVWSFCGSLGLSAKWNWDWTHQLMFPMLDPRSVSLFSTASCSWKKQRTPLRKAPKSRTPAFCCILARWAPCPGSKLPAASRQRAKEQGTRGYGKWSNTMKSAAKIWSPCCPALFHHATQFSLPCSHSHPPITHHGTNPHSLQPSATALQKRH
ncbi:hypothetical protein B0H66DRAFT_201100 [Apodospora peruviana]|uniref:Uncharacterized protein n=1 Tax=Apodospora peruviana TaxID=516989 RepID=A0AAE0IC46_9PEZI|nr:hypothetical protein B0H66DRAFT_201100 [Apodospora peruviana]